MPVAARFPLRHSRLARAARGTRSQPCSAVLVLAGYAVGGTVLACALFQRQDLQGKQ